MNTSEQKQWRGHELIWCDHCDAAVIRCEKCGETSCNGGGCELCIPDQIEFRKIPAKLGHHIEDSEWQIYAKAQRMKKQIIETLAERGVRP